MKKFIFTLSLALFTSVTVFAADYFWVGGTGNWNDFAAHWATTSGGATFHAQAPTSADNVFFDANSFSSASQVVTINVDAVCADMNWTGATNSPQLAGAIARKLSIYGSLTLIAGMNYNFLGDVYFESLNTGKTLTSAGQAFKRNVYFQGLGGYVLQDAFVQTGSYVVSLVRGTLDFNNQSFSATRFSSDNTNVRSLSFGSSTITLTYGGHSAMEFNGTNMTLNAGTSLLKFTGNGGGMYNYYGSGLAFYNVICEAATGTAYLRNRSGSFNNVVFNSAGFFGFTNTVNSLTFAGNGTINDNGNNITTAIFNSTATISDNGTYGTITMNGNGAITGSNTIGTLTLAAGKSYTITNGKTQIISNSLNATGTCALPITIQSSSVGNQTSISKSSGAVTVDYCILQDINASGGATFTANNSIDFGNNTGWTITQPAPNNLFWVGGTGNWNDPAHWATTSGGAGGSCVPTYLDNVSFDANSFTAGGQIVTIIGDQNGKVFCKNMNWTGVTNNPTLTGINSITLNIYGSLTLNPTMTYSFNGVLNFLGTTAGNTIFTAGKALDKNHIYFNGEGGGWTLMDGLNLGSKNLYFVKGSLTTNNNPVTAFIFNSDNTNTRSLNLGSSIITLTYPGHSAMEINGTNMTLNAGTSLIKFTAAGGGMYNFSGGGLAFYDVICEAATGTSYVRNRNGSLHNVVFNSMGILSFTNTINSVTFAGNGTINDNNNNISTVVFNGTATINDNTGNYGHVTMNGNGAITGNNTFGTLVLAAGKQYTLTNGKTQIIQTDLIANGLDGQNIIIKSSTAGSRSTFSKASGTVTVNYVTLSDNLATGGATFIADNSLDLGNNSGWTINAPSGKDYYWVGGTGNWNDASEWSLTSGGAGGAGVPSVIDNVFFDANSFTAPGQTVTIIGDASNNANIINMDWTGVTNNPTLAGAATQNLRIYGSLTLSPNMTYIFLGKVYFEATETGKTLFTAGLVLDKNDLYFQGAGGGWMLQDGLNLGGKVLYLVRGSLNTNNQAVNAGRFDSYYDGNIRSLTLGSSVITLNSTSYQTLYFHGTGMTLNAGTSLIRLTGAGSGFYNLQGGGLFFYNLICEATTGSVDIFNLNGGFNNIEFKSNGTNRLLYSNTVNSVIFDGTGSINSNGNNINTVVFNGNGTINDNGTYGHVTMNGNGTITGNNTFGTLIFSPGRQYTLSFNKTQTILDEFIANGTENQMIIIQSNSTGNRTTISKASGVVTVNYISLKDNIAAGGATFIANNSIDLGNNLNWTIIAPGSKDYYWVGGSGNSNDPAHWSLTSGGAGNAGIPSSIDNAYFDANSFSVAGQIVTFIGDASNNVNFLNMDWTGATNNPALAGAATQNLRIYGSMTLSPGMTYNFLGKVYFEATETGNTLSTAGLLLDKNDFYFQGAGGGWMLQDGLNLGSKVLYLVRGSLNTNNQPVNAGRFDSYYDGNIRSLTLGSSVITLTSTSYQTLYFHGTGMTLNAGTSLIRLTGAGSGFYNLQGGGLFFYDLICEATTGNVDIFNLNGGFNNIILNSNGTNRLLYGNTINNLIFNGSGSGTISDNNTIVSAVFKGNGSITGNNTFGTLEFSPGKTYTLTNGKTQTILNELIALGTCAGTITIQSSSITLPTTISKASGSVDVNQVILQGINATGGAVFTAYNTINVGNNTGWIFAPIGTQSLYWVGGSGNWNDVNHWSSESGGAGGYCLPTQLDNVIFDANSFTQTGQAVYVDVANPACKDMDWSLATFEPTFTSLSNTYNLNIYGSLILNPNMNFAFSGNVYFLGETPAKSSYLITMAGRSFNNNVYFNGNGGIWILQDAFTINNNDLYLNFGTLNTNDKTVSVRRFYSENSNARSLNLGASLINITYNNGYSWSVSGSNLIITPGTSEIRFTNVNSLFYSNGASMLTYNNVLFQNPGGASTLNSDDVFNNVVFNPSGKIMGDGTFNDVTFNGTGEIDDNNMFGDVIFFNSATIKGNNSFDNLTFTPGKLCQLQANSTQTIEGELNFWGNADNPITLQSLTSGTQATISKASGIVSGNYISLKDMNATGGATFNVYNSTDISNNTGWNFLEPPFATCPEDFDVCINVAPFVLNQALPTGWVYSGEGVYYDAAGGVYMFNPAAVTGNQSLITYTIGGLFPGSCDFTITILPLPVADCRDDIEVCAGSGYITLYEGLGNYYYNDELITGFNPVNPGIFTITYTVTNECGDASCDFYINVLPLPEATISGDLEICQGETTTLTASAGTEYLWSTDETTQSIVVGVAGDYSVTVKGENGCENSAEVTVIVHPLPVVTISGDLEICQGESTTLTASLGSSYLWSTSETTRSIEVTLAGIYSVEVTDANGCKNTEQVTVIVHPLPVVIISGDLEICQGESTTLTASLGSSYLWNTSETTRTIEVTVAGIYSVEVTDVNGCEGFAEVTVIVHPLPVVEITGDLAFCEGQSTVLTASEGSSYVWNTNQSTQSITVVMAGDYSVIVTDANGCEGSAEVTTTYLPITIPTCPVNMNVLVTNAPFALTGGLPEGGTYSGVGVTGNVFDPSAAGVGNFPITYLINDVCGPQSCEFTINVSEEPVTCEDATISNFPATLNDVCFDEIIEVDFTGVIVENAVQQIWTVNPVEAGLIENNLFYLNPAYLGDVTITLLAVAEDPCIDAQASVGFTVKPLPNYFCEFSATEICSGEEVTFTHHFEGEAPWTLEYYLGGVLMSFTTSENPYTVTQTFTETTYFEPVHIYSGNGCDEGVSQFTVIEVNPLPSYTYELSDTEVCSGEEVTYTNYFTGTQPWTVEFLYNGVLTSFTTSDNPQIYTEVLTTNTTFEPLLVTDGNGCSSDVNQPTAFTVNPLPTFTSEISDTEICYGETVNFTNYFTGTPPWTVVYEYNGVQDSFTTSDNPDYYSEVFTETTVNEIISVTDGKGCSTYYTGNISTITIHPLPIIEISGTPGFCEGQTTELTATAGESYLWNTGETTQSIVVSLAGTYSVTVTDDNGCQGTAQVATTYLPITIPACPTHMNVQITEPAFTITGEDPIGGIYSGQGVVGTNVFDPALAGLGTHTITYTIQDICGPQSCEFTISVTEEPILCEDASISNFPASAEDVCENEAYSINFSGVLIENAVEIIWTVTPPEAGSVVTNVFNLNVGYVGNVSITLLAVAEDPCLDAQAVVGFTVIPLPTFIFEVSDSEVCFGDEITFTDQFTGTAPWTVSVNKNGTLVTFISEEAILIHTEIMTQTTDYEILSVTDGTGCTNLINQSLTIIVHPLPTFSREISDTEICTGDEVTITDHFTGEAPWTMTILKDGETFSFPIEESPAVRIMTLTETLTYEIVSVTDNNGCFIAVNELVNITVHPLPVVQITGVLQFCEGSSTELTATEGVSYVWSTGQDSRSIFVTMAGDYSVIVTDVNGCEGEAQVTTTYLPITIPTCPLPMNVLVTDMPFTLTGGMPEGGTYSGAGVSGNIFDPSIGEGNYPITYLIDDLCGPQSCEFTITVTQDPILCEDATISNFPATAADVCENEAYSIDFSSVVIENAVQEIWTVTPVDAGSFAGKVFDLNIGYVGNVTISLLAVATEPCEDATASLSFTVHPLPLVECPDDFSVCIDAAPIVLNAATPSGGIYSGNGITNGIFDPVAAGEGTHQITYTYSESRIAVWDFEGDLLIPSYGAGSAVNIGGASSAFATGNGGGRGWNTSAYPIQGTNSGTAGVEFLTSTEGFTNIHIAFDQRASGTASRWVELQYTLDGANWLAFENNSGSLTPHDTYFGFAFDLSTIPGANNNPSFGIRIVSIFSPMAFNQNNTLSYGPNEAYMRSNPQATYPPEPGLSTGNYGTGGTWRFDNVNITGTPVTTCSAACTFEITVNPLPVIEITGDQELCQGESTILTATEGVSYLWSTGAITQEITVAASGDYSVVVTDTHGCEGYAEVTVIVHPLPEIEITGDTYFCEGLYTILTATEGESYLWSTGSTDPNITVTIAGDYSVTVTDENGCEGFDEVTVSYLEITMPTCPADFDIQVTDPIITLFGGLPEGGVYSGNGVVETNQFDPSIANIGAHTITYTIADVCGPQSCDFTITVTEEPVLCDDASISNFPASAEDVCEGEAYSIDFSGVVIENAIQVIWTILPVDAGAINNNVFELNVGFIGEVTIEVLAIAVSPCEDALESLSFTVNPLPVFECPAYEPFCAGDDPVALEGEGDFMLDGNTITSFTPVTPGTFLIEYTVTSEFDCTSSCVFEIVVNETPVVECPESFDVCINAAPFALAGATPVGGIYSGTGVTNGIFDPVFAGTGTHEISYAYTENRIAVWNFEGDVITPAYGLGTASLHGGTTSSFAAGNGGGRGWNTTTYPNQSIGSGTRGVQFLASTEGFTDIQISFDHRASGTGSRWAQLQYTINGTDWVIFGNNDGGLTPHDTFYSFEFDLSSIPGAANNPTFGVRIVSIFSPLAFNQNSTLSYGADEAYMRANNQATYPPEPGIGTGNYGAAGTWRFDNVMITGTPINVCSASCSFEITVNPLPEVTIIADGPTEFCEGESVELTATEGVEYLWSTGESTQSINVADAGAYSVIVTDENGCAGEAEIEITVWDLPSFVFEVDETEICAGEPVVFTNYFTGVAPWTVEYTYNDISDSFTTSENPEYYTAYFTETTIYQPITVTDGNGCTAYLDQSVTITVLPLPELTCPEDMLAYITDNPVLLNMASPAGGAYSGAGVSFDGSNYYFDPSSGIGNYEITYCYQEPVSGCENCCTFVYSVIPLPGNQQVICMPAGWTGISSYFVPDNPQLETIFTEINAANKMAIMLGEKGIYWPGQNINTLGNWDVYKGYKIKMYEPGCIEIEGEMPVDKSFTAKKGSSFIPVLCDEIVPANDIFGTLGNNLLFAYDLHSEKLYWPQGGIYTLDVLEPGKGYLVNMLQAAQITYNCTKSDIAGYVAAQPPVYENAPWSFNRSDAAHFISISTSALNELEAGDFIGVFNSDGTCAGFSQYNGEKSNLLLVAYGDDFTTDAVDGFTDQGMMSFRVFRQSTTTEMAADVVFDASMPDAGSYREQGQSKIISIKAGATSIGESKLSSIGLHPNPSNGVIHLTIPAMDEALNIEVTNMAGQVVHTEKLENSIPAHQLDLTTVNPGVYFIRITANGQTVVRKIVIQ